jgi:hypothetical protein
MARETELKWRVKENIIDTIISFIWLSAFRFTLFSMAIQLQRIIGFGCPLQLL